MSEQATLFALLIGIDCYLPNRLPGGGSYPSLQGCVRDITHVENFLKTTMHLTDNQIIKLTATSTEAREPSEPHTRWPTYKHMIEAFLRLTAMAQPGDQVYIHYSGHGGRTPTVFPDLKGEHGLDESLVPLDIGSPDGQYLRDVELAHILQTMVEKGLLVTIVLDSCHSGGATRGVGRANVRGLNIIDTTPRPSQSLVASRDILSQSWRRLSQATTRNINSSSGWLPESQGYVLLAACSSSESAYEFDFNGTEKNGALTYWLLDSFKQLGLDYTFKRLHNRLIAKIHSQFEQQTPQLQGDGDRVVFGRSRLPSPYAVTVMKVDLPRTRVRLNTGRTQAVQKGAQFAVYPPGETDFANIMKRQAVVEVTDVDATSSWASIVTSSSSGTIEQGDSAVLFDPGNARLRRTVSLLHQADLPPALPQEKALHAVKEALASSRFVEVATGETPPDFQVVVNALGAYDIWDPTGHPLANLRPALSIKYPNAAARLAHRLVHLAKYRNIQQLDNGDSLSSLARRLVVELAGVQVTFDPEVDRPNAPPYGDPTVTLKQDEWTFLRIKNTSALELNITVLDFAPDWSITQVVPTPEGIYSDPLDPGSELILPFQAFLPEGYTEGTDVLKVFATVGSTNFHWLELPPLDQAATSQVTRGRPANPLEELLAMLAVEEPKTRQARVVLPTTEAWATAQVEMHIR